MSAPASHGFPVQPWAKLLIDLGVPFRITFDLKLTTDEQNAILLADGERTATLIAARYGLEGGPPLRHAEIAARSGCTKQNVAQIEAKWRKKARRVLGLGEE